MKKRSGIHILCLAMMILFSLPARAQAEEIQTLGAPEDFCVEPCDFEDWREYYYGCPYPYIQIIDFDDYDYGFFRLSWKPVPGAKEYFVFFTMPTKEARETGSGEVTYGYFNCPWNEYCCALFQEEGVPISVTVSAVDGNGITSEQAAFAYGVTVLPNCELTCREKNGSVHLTWNSLTQLPAESIHYVIYRKMEGRKEYIRIGESNTCTYDDPDTIKGITYLYEVVTEATVEGLSGSFRSAAFEEACITVENGGDTAGYFFPDGLTAIEAESFAGTDAGTVIVPACVKRIGARAFANCPNLRMVVFMGENTEIAEDAFEGCDQQIILDRP